MTRRGMMVMVLMVSILQLPFTLAGDEKADQQAANEFKQYVSALVAGYRAAKYERVEAFPCPFMGNPDRSDIKGYHKISYEPGADYGIDVRKTDSIISPYTGVLLLDWHMHYSDCKETPEKAQADTDLKHIDSAKYKYTYAYQDGKWVPTSRDVSWHGDPWESCVDRNAKAAGYGYPAEFGCTVPN